MITIVFETLKMLLLLWALHSIQKAVRALKKDENFKMILRELPEMAVLLVSPYVVTLARPELLYPRRLEIVPIDQVLIVGDSLYYKGLPVYFCDEQFNQDEVRRIFAGHLAVVIRHIRGEMFLSFNT